MVVSNHSIQWWWCLSNHWNFAMVAKCGPKSPKSFDYAFSLQNGLVTLKWSGGFIYPLSLSSSAFVRKWDMLRLQAFLGLSIGPKPLLTIVPEFGETIEKPSIAMVNQWKNIQWWWLRGSKTIEKPLIAMVPPKKFITIPSLWKNDHRWSLASNKNRKFWEFFPNMCLYLGKEGKRSHLFRFFAGLWKFRKLNCNG